MKNSDGRSKPESILIESSEITEPQSKKPGRSSTPTVEQKERAADKRSGKNDFKRENMDIEVKNSDENNRMVTGLIGLFLFLFGFFSMSNIDDDACCFFFIMIVIGLSLITQSFSTNYYKKVGFLESFLNILLIIFIVCAIGFMILLYLITQ